MLLRYPGGKSRGALTTHLLDTIERCYSGGVFGELFFGGGGITFHLLKRRAVRSLVINDLDPSVAKFWGRVIQRPSDMKRSIQRVRPGVGCFVAAKKRVLAGTSSAVDTIIVNRMSHGGRGVMAGPQGGYDQKGQYKIDCRWNPERLCKEVQEAHDLLTSVPVRCLHKSYDRVTADFLYLDPPYYEVGNGLYHCAFSNLDHIMLAGFLYRRKDWVLSYNNHAFIRHLYRQFKQVPYSTAGNGGAKPNSELIITSETLAC